VPDYPHPLVFSLFSAKIGWYSKERSYYQVIYKEMKRLLIGSVLFALPVVALAVESPTLGNLDALVVALSSIVNLLLPLVVAIALLAFFWGLATFIFAAGNEDAKDRGKRIMIWGIIALFIMVAVWGIVAFIGNALDINIGEDLGEVPGVIPTTGA